MRNAYQVTSQITIQSTYSHSTPPWYLGSRLQSGKWSPGVEADRRDCFEAAPLDVLLNPHGEVIEGMAHCLTDYLNFCVDVLSPAKTVCCYPNNKPWVGSQSYPEQEGGGFHEQRHEGN